MLRASTRGSSASATQNSRSLLPLAREADLRPPEEVERLIEENWTLIPWVLNRLRTRYTLLATLTYEDLEQEAAIGLLSAARRWEPARSAFSTTAVLYIRQAVLRAVETQDRLIAIPSHLQTRKRRADLQALPTARRVLSLDAPVDESSSDSLGDRPSTIGETLQAPEADLTEEVERTEREQLVERLLHEASLRPAEQLVLLQRAAGVSLATLGKAMNCSRERVRQIERKARARCLKAAQRLPSDVLGSLFRD